MPIIIYFNNNDKNNNKQGYLSERISRYRENSITYNVNYSKSDQSEVIGGHPLNLVPPFSDVAPNIHTKIEKLKSFTTNNKVNA